MDLSIHFLIIKSVYMETEIFANHGLKLCMLLQNLPLLLLHQFLSKIYLSAMITSIKN